MLGYVFNPLSIFWCHDADGVLRHVVAEVHNTYGGRHAYLLPPTGDSRPRSRRSSTSRRSTTSTATTWCGRRVPDAKARRDDFAAPGEQAGIRRHAARHRREARHRADRCGCRWWHRWHR